MRAESISAMAITMTITSVVGVVSVSLEPVMPFSAEQTAQEHASETDLLEYRNQQACI